MIDGRTGRRSAESGRSRTTRRQFVEWIAVVMVAGGCGRSENDSDRILSASNSSSPGASGAPITSGQPIATGPPATPSPVSPTVSISTPNGARFCQQYLSEPDPLACEQVASAAVEIRGSVTPGADVSVANQAAQVDGDSWTARVPVEEGLSTITATATNAAGSATATVEIEYREFERSDW